MSTYLKITSLGDPTRVRVLELLREGPASVGEIAGRLPVSRPAVSQHLRLLLGAGLVRFTRDGTRHLYAVDATGVAEVRAWLETFTDDRPGDQTPSTDGSPGAPAELLNAGKDKRSKKKKRGGKKKRRKDP